MQPYHELYPSQAAIFGLVPRFVTLREDRGAATWRLDRDELRAALSDPGGQGGGREHPAEPDRQGAGRGRPGVHRGTVPDPRPVRDYRRDLRAHHVSTATATAAWRCTKEWRSAPWVVNSISKTGRATGWRIGWVITPPERTPALRAVHDNLVVQAPTPVAEGGGVAAAACRGRFFAGIAEGYRRKRDLLVPAGPVRGRIRGHSAGRRVLPVRRLPRRAALTGMAPTQAAMFLIEQAGVATVPGDNFYTTGRGRRPLPAIRLLALARHPAVSRRTAPRRASLVSRCPGTNHREADSGQGFHVAADDSPFLANRDRTPLVHGTVHQVFVAVRQAAGLHSPVGGRRRPRLHDLRPRILPE